VKKKELEASEKNFTDILYLFRNVETQGIVFFHIKFIFCNENLKLQNYLSLCSLWLIKTK
jgi:hypothetical protein